jgi:hypothetical protein
VALADIPVVHVIGSPRSGTTWLQHMLGAHPAVATPFEPEFFSGFAVPWYAIWDQQCAGGAGKPPFWGLPSALTTQEFEEAVGLVAERIYRSVLAAKPTATLVLEKDPRSSVHVPAIVRTMPHVRFIHMLRDGRDVACSLVRASSSFGKAWAPKDAGSAAHLWQASVRGAQLANGRAAGYMEVRYEDLLSERGPELLAECLAFCAVDDDPALAARLYERYRYPRKSKQEVLTGSLVWAGEAERMGARLEFPDDFIGPAAAGIWQQLFEPDDRRAFDEVAGELLVEVGYEPDRSWAQPEPPQRVRRWSFPAARGSASGGGR